MSIIFRAVGDVVAFHNHPEIAFEHVSETLQEADITFGQNERHYADDTDHIARGDITEVESPEHAQSLKDGGFDVVSFASNHTIDLGEEQMVKTIDVLNDLGFDVIGAGRNLSEAREPVIYEREGTTIGFLAYCSVLRAGDEAREDSPGAAPIRAWTLYDQVDYQPGTPPRILTFPYREDLNQVKEDVKRLKEQVDLVILSCHWGVHYETATIADYQKEVAHAAIDSGADAIIGHHPHLLKGVEVYDSSPIFYSMGNFAFDFPIWKAQELKEKNLPEFKARHDLYEMDLIYDSTSPWENYAFPPESRRSLMAEFEISNQNIEGVYFYPVNINENAQPSFIQTDSDDYQRYLEYLRDITEREGLGTEYEVRDGKIQVVL